MNTESNQYDFVENFAGFHYISNAQFLDNGQLIKAKLELIPLRQIAIFMFCVILAVPLGLLFYSADTGTILGLSIAAVCSGGMFVGLLWLVNQTLIDAKLPYIDKEHEELTLPSGTKIAKDDIAYFRQFECKTKSSNFRLVLTSVVTSSQNEQFAVCVEIGRFKTTNIGKEIARHFGAEIKQDLGVVKTQDLLQKLALE